jgi:uncharacterized protein (TIGR00369 family)
MHNQIPDHIRMWIDRIPIFAAFELDVRAVTASAATLYMPFRPQLTGIFESLHGGLLMTLADTAACVAVLAALSGDDVITTTDMNIRFLGPCLTGATATARVIKAGRTLCPTHVNITDESGSLVAIAQVTYMRLPNMPKRKR